MAELDQYKIRTLNPDEIEVKIKQVTSKGAVALLYKTARVDMSILDETFGAMNWEDDYKEIKGNLFCGIGVRENIDAPFVWKWDCGIESREDEEGNEKKGEASDAFKRAGFKWGIGRELYTAPFIFLNLPTKQGNNGKYELEDRYMRFFVSDIRYKNKTIDNIVISDNKGNIVYGKVISSFICSNCGKEITGIKTKSGKSYTASEVSVKCGGMCLDCYNEKHTTTE